MSDLDEREYLILPNGAGVLRANLSQPCGHGERVWHIVEFLDGPITHGVVCLTCLPPRSQQNPRGKRYRVLGRYNHRTGKIDPVQQ